MTRFLILSFIFVAHSALAQFTYQLEQGIPVADKDGNLLPMPWGGGLNAAQYNTFDLNNDDKDDLVLFDRMANKVITFLNLNNEYQYAPHYENLFPEEAINWMLLRDFNCDGKKDIFTADLLGIKVFMNTTLPGEQLSWEKFLFYSGTSGPKSDVILTKGFSGMINLQIQFDDLPAIVDADGDGDLDILNVRFTGDGSVEYHKNFSQERFGTCDSLTFERMTQTWGNFRACHCGEFALNGSDCPTGGRTKHAGGKALLAIDANGDNAIDLVFSEAECSQQFLLPNEGTADSPVINSFTTFPETTPVDLEIFPAAFYEDVDFDGIKDLIAAPNVFHKETQQTNLEQSSWYYKNTGSDAVPDFAFEKNNFLQDQMIEVGDNAVPAFADLEGDSDLDLFISRNSSMTGPATIFLYENIGTSTAPSFQLATDDYLEFSNSDFFNLKIQFTDLDNNGTTDLAFTATDDLANLTKLYYYANTNSDGLNFDGQTPQQISFNLTGPENISLTDVNDDNLPDILIGKSSGALEYWRNNGTGTAPSFVLEEANFLGFESSVEIQNISAASGDLDNDGKTDLVIGDQTGEIKIIGNYKNESERLSEIIYNPLSDSHVAFNLGGRIWPVIVDLFNSGKPAIVVGNTMGGVQVLKSENDFTLFPNPVSKGGSIVIQVDEPMVLRIYSSTGQLIDGPVALQRNVGINEKIPNLSAGLYIFRFDGQKKSFSRKIVVR